LPTRHLRKCVPTLERKQRISEGLTKLTKKVSKTVIFLPVPVEPGTLFTMSPKNPQKQRVTLPCRAAPLRDAIYNLASHGHDTRAIQDYLEHKNIQPTFKESG